MKRLAVLVLSLALISPSFAVDRLAESVITKIVKISALPDDFWGAKTERKVQEVKEKYENLGYTFEGCTYQPNNDVIVYFTGE